MKNVHRIQFNKDLIVYPAVVIVVNAETEVLALNAPTTSYLMMDFVSRLVQKKPPKLKFLPESKCVKETLAVSQIANHAQAIQISA